MQTITPPHIYSAAMSLYRKRLVPQVLLVYEPQTIGEELVKAQSSCCKRQRYSHSILKYLEAYANRRIGPWLCKHELIREWKVAAGA